MTTTRATSTSASSSRRLLSSWGMQGRRGDSVYLCWGHRGSARLSRQRWGWQRGLSPMPRVGGGCSLPEVPPPSAPLWSCPPSLRALLSLCQLGPGGIYKIPCGRGRLGPLQLPRCHLCCLLSPEKSPGGDTKNLRGPFPGISPAALGVPRQTAGSAHPPHPTRAVAGGAPTPSARTRGGTAPLVLHGQLCVPPPGRGRSWLDSLFPRAPCQGRRRWTPGMGEMGAWDGRVPGLAWVGAQSAAATAGRELQRRGGGGTAGCVGGSPRFCRPVLSTPKAPRCFQPGVEARVWWLPGTRAHGHACTGMLALSLSRIPPSLPPLPSSLLSVPPSRSTGHGVLQSRGSGARSLRRFSSTLRSPGEPKKTKERKKRLFHSGSVGSSSRDPAGIRPGRDGAAVREEDAEGPAPRSPPPPPPPRRGLALAAGGGEAAPPASPLPPELLLHPGHGFLRGLQGCAQEPAPRGHLAVSSRGGDRDGDSVTARECGAGRGCWLSWRGRDSPAVLHRGVNAGYGQCGGLWGREEPGDSPGPVPVSCGAGTRSHPSVPHTAALPPVPAATLATRTPRGHGCDLGDRSPKGGTARGGAVLMEGPWGHGCSPEPGTGVCGSRGCLHLCACACTPVRVCLHTCVCTWPRARGCRRAWAARGGCQPPAACPLRVPTPGRGAAGDPVPHPSAPHGLPWPQQVSQQVTQSCCWGARRWQCRPLR